MIVCISILANENAYDSDHAKKILSSLGLSAESFTPIDIFGQPVDRIEEIDGVFYLTSKTLKKDERWEIVIGTPEVDSLLKAKDPAEFINALARTGNANNLAVSWKGSEVLFENMRIDPNSAFDVNVRRIYIDSNHIYTLAFKAVLRNKPLDNASPDLVTIPMLILQRFDATVIKRLLE